MSRDEWLRRYKARFVNAGLTTEQAEDCANAESFECLSSGGFEDDPEGAADEEMSYWSD